MPKRNAKGQFVSSKRKSSGPKRTTTKKRKAPAKKRAPRTKKDPATVYRRAWHEGKGRKWSGKRKAAGKLYIRDGPNAFSGTTEYGPARDIPYSQMASHGNAEHY